MERVLVVGSGLTGALCASLLRHEAIANNVSVWEKSKGTGGRMSTSRSPKDPRSTVDLGAQYISPTTEDFQAHQKFYDELIQAGVLTQLTGEIVGDTKFSGAAKHFVTPGGVSTIVKHFLHKSGADVTFNERIVDISQENSALKVSSESGKTDVFDAVILTMPVPQVLQLAGSISSVLASQPDVKQKLENVSYSSRYALGMFYKPDTVLDLPWCAKYFTGHSCVRFVSIDNKKRGIEDTSIGTSVAVHASVPFSIEHLEENLDHVCSDILLPSVLELIPQLPKPDHVKNHKWRYSQIHRTYEGEPGAVVLHRNPLIIVAGDAFSKSGFNGCVNSALKTIELFKNIKS